MGISKNKKILRQTETNRFHLRAEYIEQLSSDDDLLIIDIQELGQFKMTRKELFEHPPFVKAMRSRSYLKNGDYHCPGIPKHLERFRYLN